MTTTQQTAAPGSLLAEVQRSGLTGRGGAAFPTAVKIEAALSAKASLIVNACDGELGAAKDSWIVANHLDELVRGASLLAPGRRKLGVRFAAHRDSVTAQALHAAGLEVLEVPHRYVSSEESSLISLANGGLARPMTKRVPFVYGGADSTGRRIPPTVVLNAETVWRVAQIAERGAQWFRSFGTHDEPGPRLATITGAVPRPGIVQTQAGTPLRDLLAAAGTDFRAVEYVLVGGLGGSILTIGQAEMASWSKEGLAAYGGSPGPGVIEVLDPVGCPAEAVARLLTFAAGESAGQCGPCMFGVPALAKDWEALIAAPTPGKSEKLAERTSLLANRGACRFPDGVGGFASSALRVLSPHLQSHVGGRCPRSARGVDSPLAGRK